MKSNYVRDLIRTGLTLAAVIGMSASAWAQKPNVAVSRPVQPVQPTQPIVEPPGGVRPVPPIYRPPGVPIAGSGGWVDTSQQFGLPCPGSTSIIAGTIYYVCGDRYFLEQPGPNGSTYVQVASPL